MKRPGGASHVWLLVLLPCLLLSALAGLHQTRLNQAVIDEETSRLAARVGERIQARMALYEYGLRGLRGVYVASDRLTLEEFNSYSQNQDLAREFPGSRGFGIIVRVRPGEEAGFVEHAIRDGQTDFRIQTLNAHQGDRYIIEYIESGNTNAPAVGLDIASEPRRREAALNAIRTGQISLSAPITIVQAPDKPDRAFLIMLPIYQPGLPTDSPATREAACIGLSYAPLVIDEVLMPLLRQDPGLYALRLRDPGASVSAPFFDGYSPPDALPELPARRMPVQVFDRSWELEIQPTRRFLQGLRITQASAVLLAGVILSLVLAGLLQSLASARWRKSAALAALNDTLEAQISERTALLDSAHRTLRTIMDSVPSMIGYWDRDLINRAANNAYRHIFVAGRDAPEGRPMRELLGPALYGRNQSRIEAVLRGEPQIFEREVTMTETGETRHVQVHFIPDLDDGVVRGFHTLAHDITDLVTSRGRLASALRENAALLQTINDQTIVSVTDSRGIITEVNDSFCRISGYAREELIGHTHSVVNSGHHGPEFWTGMWQTVSSGRSWRREVCNRARDGSLYWVDSIIAPFRGDDGRIEKYISIRSDITARKETESAFARTTTLLSGVLEAASEVSIVASDPDGLITVFNSGAERMLGYSADEMVGRQTPAIFHPEEEIRARASELALEAGREVSGFDVFVWHAEREGSETRDWTYVRKNGSRFPVSLTVTCIRNEALEIQGYLGIAHDISQHQEYAHSLRDAMLREKRANLAKSQFLANMSHEIRTPMNAVIGLSFLLEQTRLNPEQAELLGKLQVAGKSLLSIINDILDISKIEAGELVIERAPFLFSYLIRETMQLFENPAREKRIRLEVINPISEDLVFEGDVTRLRQILVNLLSNAIKFTEQGEVRLRIGVLSASAEAMQLRFEVSDTGIGIAAEAVPRLFQPFSQEDASTTRRFGGTGLGLSIVRQLVSLMHGELGVTSTPGQGSSFWFELSFPIAPTQLADQANSSDANMPGCLADVRLLIVDDSEINRMVASRILELAGAQVVTASNGQEAVDLLTGGLETELVLMDLHMPVMDGFDATRQIRATPGLQALPVVALSAGTMEANRAQALECGMNDFVGKPFNADKLVACIRRHLAAPPALPVRHGASAESAPATRADWPQIEGIDAAEASERFAGDTALFLRMLRRLLDEFADLSPDTAAPPETLAHRLHALKGNAGTLGAQALARSTARAEEAVSARDTAQVSAALATVQQQMAALARHARPFFDQPEAGETMPAEALGEESVEALLKLLRQADLDALALHAELAGRLQDYLGSEPASRLTACVNGLMFEDAIEILQNR